MLKNRRIRIYVYKKDVAYPFSFVGSSSYLISKNLGIPPKEAGLLLIAKINDVLRSVADAAIKDVLKLRVKRIQTAMKPKKPKKCVNCGQSFSPKRKRQQRCNKCISN
jgi:predicted Zn-ribbon and HTH transcriptional regulator